jgi:hypothetical protein
MVLVLWGVCGIIDPMMSNQYTAEWGFILGDALDEYNSTSHSAEAQYEEEQRDLLEAMADEVEMTDEVVDDWYQSLLDKELAREEREVWSDFWNDKERA